MSHSPAPAATSRSRSSRDVAELLRRLREELRLWHVPGLEVAVVRGSDVLAAEGLGRRSVHTSAPATGRTLFHHGSCGKAFTALTVAHLAVQGLVDLDEPLRRWLPELRLADPDRAARITLRDVLSHRSGISRHDLAWILNPSWDGAELLRRLEHLPLAAGLRERMEYTNLGYTLAGLAIERVTGRPWHEELRERVLAPSGMHRTGTALDLMLSDEDSARPHLLRGDEVGETDYRPLGGAAPAGSVITCAEDTARWLQLQLGTRDDVPADLSAAVRLTHETAVELPAEGRPFPELVPQGYALGWVVATYRGHRLLWHSGGVDGFLTQTYLLPEQGVGVAVCANLHMSPLPLAAGLSLLDQVLEEDDSSWLTALAPAAAGAARESESATTAAATVSPALPRPSSLPGRYSHPGYGDLCIAAAENGLTARLGDSTVLMHHDGGTSQLRYEPLDVTYPMTFSLDEHGAVECVHLPLDPSTGTATFRRTDLEAR